MRESLVCSEECKCYCLRWLELRMQDHRHNELERLTGAQLLKARNAILRNFQVIVPCLVSSLLPPRRANTFFARWHLPSRKTVNLLPRLTLMGEFCQLSQSQLQNTNPELPVTSFTPSAKGAHPTANQLAEQHVVLENYIIPKVTLPKISTIWPWTHGLLSKGFSSLAILCILDEYLIVHHSN